MWMRWHWQLSVAGNNIVWTVPAHVRSSSARRWQFWRKWHVHHLFWDVNDVNRLHWNIWRMWDLHFHYHSGCRNIRLSVSLFIFMQCSLHFLVSGVSSKCRQDELLMCKFSCENNISYKVVFVLWVASRIIANEITVETAGGPTKKRAKLSFTLELPFCIVLFIVILSTKQFP